MAFSFYNNDDDFGGGLLARLMSLAGPQNYNNAGLPSDAAQYGQQPAPMPPQMQMAAANGPSPLDAAQWPAGPAGAPQAAAAPQSLPPPQMAAGPQPQGLGDRLSTSFQSWANTPIGNPMAALANGIAALNSGRRTDPTGVALQQQEIVRRELTPLLGEHGAMVAALNPQYGQQILSAALDNQKHAYGFQTLPDGTMVATDPKTGRVTPVYQAPSHSYGFQTLPDGTIVATDSKTGKVAPAYQAPTKPEFGIISESDGQKIYGWRDHVTREVTPVAIENEKDGTVTGPDGKQIQIPPGVDRQTFIKEISKTNADAATGKLTESQAKSSGYAARMELAEKNLQATQAEGTRYWGRLTDSLPGVGGTAATNTAQSESYQKFKQAKDNFIAALLRQESGAAIGKSEYEAADKQYFPQPGDSDAVIKQKAETRAAAIEQMKRSAGPGYKPPSLSRTAPDPLGIR